MPLILKKKPVVFVDTIDLILLSGVHSRKFRQGLTVKEEPDVRICSTPE